MGNREAELINVNLDLLGKTKINPTVDFIMSSKSVRTLGTCPYKFKNSSRKVHITEFLN